MKRREFISLVGGAAVAWPLATLAQTRLWRMAYLVPDIRSPIAARMLDTFKKRLREFGYIEGDNLVLDLRSADGNFSRLPTLAAELVSLRPDIIVAVATPSIAAAQRATSSVPIVMSPVTDPIGSGFVKSLAKPGGNITGVSNMTTDLTAKSLETLNILVPRAGRIAILMSTNPVHPLQLTEAQTAARTLGLTIIPVTAALPANVEAAFSTMAQQDCDGLLVLSDPRIIPLIPELAAKARLPTIYQFAEFVRLGGLISYGPDLIALYNLAAVYVDKILKGANPAELPVEQPTKFQLAINLKTAKALGLTIPDKLLALADEVIE